MVKLIDKTETAVAQPAALIGAQTGQTLRGHQNLTGTGHIQPTENVQQRRFTGTRGPHYGNPLASMSRHVHAPQNGYIHRPLTIVFVDASALQHRPLFIIHNVTTKPVQSAPHGKPATRLPGHSTSAP